MSRGRQFVVVICGNVLLLLLLVLVGNRTDYLFTRLVMYMLGFVVFNLLLLRRFKRGTSPKADQ